MTGPFLLFLAASCVPPQATTHLAEAGGLTVPVASAAPITARATVVPLEPAAVQPSLAMAPFVTPATEDVTDRARALDCLTAAVYYEARSEPVDGQRAVAQVVLNRVRSPAFPNSVCGVVYQGARLSTGCQFTFTCDGSLLARREPAAWERSRAVAEAALSGDVYAPIGTATFYHTVAVSPWWAPSLTPVATVGTQIFYRWPGALGMTGAFGQRYTAAEPLPSVTDRDTLTPMAAVMRYVVDGGVVMVHRGTIADAATDPTGAAPAGPADAAAGDATASAAPSAPPVTELVQGVRVHLGTEHDADGSQVTVHRGSTTTPAVVALGEDQPKRPVT